MLTQDDSDSENESILSSLDIQNLQKIIENHKNLLKPSKISDLARDLRSGDGFEEDFMILESICLQLS